MAIVKNTRDNKCPQGFGDTGTCTHCWWECRLVRPLWKTVWRVLNKWKLELPYDPAIPLLGICPKEIKTGHRRDICTPCSPPHCSQYPRPGNNLSAHQQMNRGHVGLYIFHYVYVPLYILHKKECYSAMRKNSILPFAMTWKKLGGVMLSETSTKRGKCCMVSFIRGIGRQNS